MRPRRPDSAWIRTWAVTFVLCATPALALAGPGVPVGEAPTWLRVGAPLRLTPLSTPKGSPVLGKFREARGESIWVEARNSGKTVALSLNDVDRFEVSSEQYPRTWAGAGLGFLAGAAAGVATGASEGSRMGDTEARIVADAIVLGALGMALGALVGDSIKGDRWDLLWSRHMERPK